MNNIDFDAIAPSALPALLCQAPKAELHMHIEGSLEPELIFKLAQRNGVQLAYADVEALRQAYAFSDLQSFLDIYYAGASVLLTEADFFDMAWAYFERAAADHIVHTEIFFDPQTHTSRGVAMQTVITGLHLACQKARVELGLSAELILCFLRHLSEEEALATLEAALPWREHFIGVGLDSTEEAWATALEVNVMAHVRAARLLVPSWLERTRLVRSVSLGLGLNPEGAWVKANSAQAGGRSAKTIPSLRPCTTTKPSVAATDLWERWPSM